MMTLIKLNVLILFLFQVTPSYSEAVYTQEECDLMGIPMVDSAMFRSGSDCLNNRQNKIRNRVAFYTQDKQICDCMRGTKTTIANFMKSSDGISASSDVLNLANDINAFKINFESALNKLPNNGWVYAPNAEQARNSMLYGIIKTEEADQLFKKKQAEFNRRITDLADRVNPNLRDAIKEKISKMAIPTIANFDTFSTPAPGQCVSRQTFETTKLIPTDGEFFDDIQGMQATFNEEDWANLNQKSQNSPRNNALRARNKLLTNNPLLAELFALKAEKPEDVDYIKGLKQKAFTVIKSLAPTKKDCKSKGLDCWKDIMRSNSGAKFNSFRSELSNVFNNDRTKALIMASASNKLAENLSNRERSQIATEAEDFSNPNNYFEFLRSKDSPLLEDCSKDNVSRTECFIAYNVVCDKLISSYKDQTRMQGPHQPASVRSENKSRGRDRTLDKGEFESFVDSLCNTKLTANGRTENFGEYKNRICAGATPSAKCNDEKLLLSDFLSTYKDRENPENNQYLEAVSGIVKNTQSASVTSAQLQAVRSNTGTNYSAFREKYKGGIPEVSQSGEFVPSTSSESSYAASNSAQIAPTTPSTATTTSTSETSTAATESTAQIDPGFTPTSTLPSVASVNPGLLDSSNSPRAIQDKIERATRNDSRISSEISSLERKAETDGNTENPALSRELEDLKAQLADNKTTIDDLQKQLDSQKAEEETAEAAATAAASATRDNSSTVAQASQTGTQVPQTAAQALAPATGFFSNSSTSLQNTGSSSSGSSGGGTASPERAVSSSDINSALQSAQASRTASPSGTSLTVASSPSIQTASADLLSKTPVESVTVPVSQAEYGLIIQGNFEKISTALNTTKLKAGEVVKVRLNITGEGYKDMLATLSSGKIVIYDPRNNRAPASIAAPSRAVRLNDLQNTLPRSGN